MNKEHKEANVNKINDNNDNKNNNIYNNISALTCKTKNACVPTSINLYFNRRIFNSYAHYWTMQKFLVDKALRVSCDNFELRLSSVVLVNGHKVKRRMLFNSKVVNLRKWPPILARNNNKAIFDYRHCDDKSTLNGHAEAVLFKTATQDTSNLVSSLAKSGGVNITLRRLPIVRRLPFTDCSIEDYVSMALRLPSQYQLTVFQYKQLT